MQSRFQNHLAHLVILLATLCFVVSEFHCVEAPLEPILPTSDIQLSIPLMNRIKYVREFASKDTALKPSNGGYIYKSRQAFSPIRIDTFKLDPAPRSQQVQLGSFTVDPPTPLSVSFTYQQLTGLTPPSSPFIVPAGNLTIPAENFGPLSTFEYFTLVSGKVTLRVRNNLPFPLQLSNAFILKNNKTTSPIDTNEVYRFSFGGRTIQPGQADSVISILSNVTVQNLLRLLQSTSYTTGSGGLVSVTAQSGLILDVSFANISVQAAKAQIPAQNVYSFQDSVFTLDDSTSVQYASFRSGSFNIVLQNQIDVDATVHLKVAEIYSRLTGQGYTVSYQFSGKGIFTIPVDVRDYEIRVNKDTMGTHLTFTVEIDAIQSQGFRELRNTDYVRADFVPTASMYLQSFGGRVKPTRVSVSSGASGRTLAEVSSRIRGTVSFDSIGVALDFGMANGFAADYDLRLVAMNRKTMPAMIDSLDIPAPVGRSLKRIYPDPNRSTQIILGSTSRLNTFLPKFFPNLPDTFIVRGSMTVNPPDIYPTAEGRQGIQDTSKLYSSVDVTFPLKLSIVGGEFVETVDFRNESTFPRNSINNVRSGTIYFEVLNGLPFTLSFRAALLRNTPLGRDTTLYLPKEGPQSIDAAPVDQGGSVVGTRLTRFSIPLLGTDIDKFNASDALWYSVQIVTPGSGSTNVTIRADDSLKITASASIIYTANKQ